jgi:hypothetical protein
MMAPFNRRDSGALAIGAGLMVIVIALSLAPGSGWPALGLSAASVVLTMVVLFALLRRLPPDLALHAMPSGAAAQAIAPSPSGAARLRIAVLPEALSWYRLDLYLDGVRVGQLRPGTALVRPMPAGEHALTMRLWLRWLGGAEMINALPGTDTDIVVRGGGGKARSYSIERRDMASVLQDRRIVLVEPPGPALESA